MSYLVDGYHSETVATAPVDARVRFIRRTYAHLGAAILAFVGIEAVLFSSGLGMDILKTMFAFNGAWIALMLLFVVGGFAAQAMARSRSSVGLQYAGLAMYVLLEVVIFLPILAIAEFRFPGQYLPLQAGILTLAVFGGLTAAVFASKRDFSFLGPVLWVASLLALGLVVAAVIGGFNLGLVFAVAMVGSSSTTPRTSSTTTAPTSTSPPASSCSPRWPCCSGTSCGSSCSPGTSDPRARIQFRQASGGRQPPVCFVGEPGA
jgi:FtsH-binding integral membrane protein